MSYGGASALQQAIYQRLNTDPALTALTGGTVLDAAPSGPAPDLYVRLGEEDMRWRGDSGGGLAEHRFTVDVHAGPASFATAKAAAAAVEAALNAAPLAPTAGRVVSLRLERTRARRGRNQAARRIEMRFRAVLDEI